MDWKPKHKRAHRLLHAAAICDQTSSTWKIYQDASQRPFGNPIHFLLSYYYIKQIAKNDEQFIKIVEQYQHLGRGKIFIDSGVFTFMGKVGIKHGIKDAHVPQLDNDLDKFQSFVEGYAHFLKITDSYWDIAIDFDADTFLGSCVTDELHRILLDRSRVSKDRIMRVYHSARKGVYNWWKDLCRNENYQWIGIEGILHRWNPDFYSPLIDIAHHNGKLVHVLAATPLTFLRNVSADSVDSSTHTQGGRNAILLTPLGIIDFKEYQKDKHSKNHYSQLDTDTYAKLLSFIDFMDYKIDDLLGKEGTRARNVINLLSMNGYYDVPFIETSRQMDLFRSTHFEE